MFLFLIEDGNCERVGGRCVFENHAGTVTLIPQEGAMCSVNGTVVTHPCQLTQGKLAPYSLGETNKLAPKFGYQTVSSLEIDVVLRSVTFLPWVCCKDSFS